MLLSYVIGVPGAGKSTLMRNVTHRWMDVEVVDGGVPHIEYHDDVTWALVAVEIGRRREQFSGTDALGMAIMPKAIAWIGRNPAPWVIGEGDRLASAKFFGSAKASGYDLDIVLLDCPEDLAEARRAERGSTQNATWLAGRHTKVANLEPFVTRRLDASMPPPTLAQEFIDGAHRMA